MVNLFSFRSPGLACQTLTRVRLDTRKALRLTHSRERSNLNRNKDRST